MNDVFLKRTVKNYDCETCGGYTTTHIVVEKDGRVVLDLFADDHLGGGLEDLSDPLAVSFRILTALGLPVRLQDDDVQT